MEKEKEKLFIEHLKYSKQEDVAKNKRLEIESKIENLYKFHGKSKTFNEEIYKINIKKNFSVILDQEKYSSVRTQIPEEKRPEKIKFELDSAGFLWLKENDEKIYKLVSNCVTEKQNKSTISVEKI